MTRYLPLLAEPVPTDTQKKRPLLAKYIQQYTARNTMDYFIHKDLGGFLKRELDFYIKNELMRLDDIENADAPRVEQYLGKIKALRRIAHQLIAFLAQLEDFQKKLWLKKKFVTETHYCITLDRVPESLYPAIAANDAQREEWVKLFAIDEIVGDTAQVGYSVPLTVEFLKGNPFLLVDTALFGDDFKANLLTEIENLDAQCDGVLIHSENFQAINTIIFKYQECVNFIYIDPPYNTDATVIEYKNGYRESSWISLVEGRISAAKKILKNDGVHALTIDDYEHALVRNVLDSNFHSDNYLSTVVIRNNPSGRSTVKGFSINHEYALFHAKNINNVRLGRLPHSEDQQNRYDNKDQYGNFEWENFRKSSAGSERANRPKQFYPIYLSKKGSLRIPNLNWDEKNNSYKVIDELSDGEIAVWPIDASGNEKVWRWGLERAIAELNSMISKNPENGKLEIYAKKYINTEGVLPRTWWDKPDYSARDNGTRVLRNMFLGKIGFDFPKSLNAVSDSIKIGCPDSKGFVFDYYGGSGTTAHSVIELNREENASRKYLTVEMGAHFITTTKPRAQKAIYSKNWKDGKPVDRDGISHCFKYLRLESYEDTLNNLSLQTDPARERALADNPALRKDYVLNYWLDVETQGSQSLLNVAAFRDPTAYTMRIKQPGRDVQRLQRIDLIETFNWLIGLWVEHMAAPQTLEAEFTREVDPVLPKDQNTRLVCKRVKRVEAGPYWFRLVEGYTLQVPGDDSSRQKTLVVWRKLTDDAEKDNAVLQHFLMEKLAISPREHTYAVIYVNGSHTLPNPVVEGEQTKVRLIEEAFHTAMWANEGGV
ncbi:site-specific DNA-methyltransferase [Limnohabitans sp. DM1]|uniref:site-specific DNA-methyltransferase n=1 Tax=Limnohabitans sp. DM1 TaxID=1597955 RepID=UPI000AD9682C|nr:site-specific DNA-methyltransferase [Limnohabitans sp. DM1]